MVTSCYARTAPHGCTFTFLSNAPQNYHRDPFRCPLGHHEYVAHVVVYSQCVCSIPYGARTGLGGTIEDLVARNRFFQAGISNCTPQNTSLCNPRDHCTHSLFQDCCIVKRITSNRETYLHTNTTLRREIVLYALVRKTMHVVIVGKLVRTRRISDRYCTRVWMSGMFWCDQ